MLGPAVFKRTLYLSSWERLELQVEIIHFDDKLADDHVVKDRMGMCMSFGNHFFQKSFNSGLYEQYEWLKFQSLEEQTSWKNVCWSRLGKEMHSFLSPVLSASRRQYSLLRTLWNFCFPWY
jgi:hypothetical protein